ncbi:hypothetical protein ACQP2T_06620 [Nonomuraea sp. CA-143628]|uniref:hypothetical protein n=1 Tax=Nonomuraea sp. CA-143628 TaxID=3239997 RepID=UPI003D936012
MVKGSQLRHPTAEEALEVLRGDKDAARRRELRRHVASLRDDLVRDAAPEQALRLRAVSVLLDALGDDLAESARAVADHAYMGHLTDEQKAVIVLKSGKSLSRSGPRSRCGIRV